MSTCKDCLHYEVCKELRYGDISNCNSDGCGGLFKPQADYVEVVRCGDCKHCELIYPIKAKSKEPEPLYYCCSLECPTKPTDFCSYGERKIENA